MWVRRCYYLQGILLNFPIFSLFYFFYFANIDHRAFSGTEAIYIYIKLILVALI